MIKEAIDFIGTENLEYMALQAHKPLPAVYVFVDFNGKIVKEIRNERRIDFNSKFRMMNYYSELVSIQKPIKSKLVFSNNYLTFFLQEHRKTDGRRHRRIFFDIRNTKRIQLFYGYNKTEYLENCKRKE